MIKVTRYALFLLGFLILAVSSRGAGEILDEGKQVIVLANGNMDESIRLARYYMSKRGVPDDHLCVLDLPDDEVISRRTYVDRLQTPLMAFLREKDLLTRQGQAQIPKFRYLVSMYGVPLRIDDSRLKIITGTLRLLGKHEYEDGAAVDSELTLLLAPPPDFLGPVNCPLYNRVTLPPKPNGIMQSFIMATRLDGPNPRGVEQMIDEALYAERYGLLGRAYFDARGLSSDDGHFMGDFWIRESLERFAREGFECVRDSGGGLWGPEFPMEDAVIYMGWYTEHFIGPFERSTFHFRSGAVAYHLHSSGCKTLRSSSKHWCGPLLSKGACATFGAVAEPYLAFTPHVNIFSDRLCRGYNFAQSAYMAIPAVSWQIAVMGDPLYRPFRYTLEEQIAHLQEDSNPDIEWAYIRKANLLAREGRLNVAIDFLRIKIKEQDSLLLREKLGDLYAMNKLLDFAGEQYWEIINSTDSSETAVRVGTRWIMLLNALGQAEKAMIVKAHLKKNWADSRVYKWLDTMNVP